MLIRRVHGLDAAGQVRGPAIVIDTFRAFTTAAFLLDAGVDRLLLATELDEARALAHDLDAVLCGEDGGRRPDDFDLGNAPGEVRAAGHRVRGRTVVMRSTAGTRCLVGAHRAGARPLWAASLVVVSATARAVADNARLTIVSAGRSGVEPAPEDDVTGDLIVARLEGRPIDPRAVAELRDAVTARRLATADWAHPDDLDLCLDVDRFPFAMEARSGDGTIELVAVR